MQWPGAPSGASGAAERSTKVKTGEEDGNPDRKLLLQLEARVRDLEADHVTFRGPFTSQIYTTMKEAQVAYNEAVSTAGAGHKFGSPHLSATRARMKALANMPLAAEATPQQKILQSATVRLATMTESSLPSDVEEWCHSCRVSELYAKSGQPKMARLTFSMTGQWLIGGTMEQETAINAMVDAKTLHPHQQTIKDGQTYVTLERLIGGSLRAAGWIRLPGKAPVGGIAYKLRGRKS